MFPPLHPDFRQRVLAGLACALFSLVACAQAPVPAAPPLPDAALNAVYRELVATHDGSLYQLEIAYFPSETAAQSAWKQIDAPRFRMVPLSKALTNVTARRMYAFAMLPRLRAKIRTLEPRGRTGPLDLGARWAIAELRAREAVPAPSFQDAEQHLPGLVASGALPAPEALANDPFLRARTLANGVLNAEALSALPPGFDVDIELSSGLTLLRRAILRTDMDMLSALLQRGARPDRCAAGFCPLQAATFTNSALEITNRLLAAGADPNRFDPANGETMAPLSQAAARGRLDVARRLIDAGADLNGGASGTTPLMWASVYANREIAHLLLERGADPFARSRTLPERTALDYARDARNTGYEAWLRDVMVSRARTSPKFRWSGVLEQDGIRHALDGKPLILRRAPFRIAVQMASDGYLFASAGADRRIFDDLKAGDRGNQMFNGAATAAERNDGTSADLNVFAYGEPGKSRGGGQVWWHRGDETRFTRVEMTARGPEYVREVRTLVHIDADDKQREVPLDTGAPDAIFLVLGALVPLSWFDQDFVEPRTVELRFR